VSDTHLGEFGLGSVDRLRFPLTKDGVAWTAIDSVELVFEKPDRATQFSRAMTLETPDAGVWYYDTTTTDLDTVGFWTLNLRVTDGAVVKRFPGEISLEVRDQP
jgi:hypothetical protein